MSEPIWCNQITCGVPFWNDLNVDELNRICHDATIRVNYILFGGSTLKVADLDVDTRVNVGRLLQMLSEGLVTFEGRDGINSTFKVNDPDSVEVFISEYYNGTIRVMYNENGSIAHILDQHYGYDTNYKPL